MTRSLAKKSVKTKLNTSKADNEEIQFVIEMFNNCNSLAIILFGFIIYFVEKKT